MAQNKNESKNLRFNMKAKIKHHKPSCLTFLKGGRLIDLDKRMLHKSVVTNKTEAVIQLLNTGVNPNTADNLMRSPLHLAASRGYKEMVTILIEYGADPNARDVVGNTALHLAACTNNIEIVTLLLDAGTDMTLLDRHGKNPLQLAESKLKLIQNNRREGAIEFPQLRSQIQQVNDLMISFLKRAFQKNTTNDMTMQRMNLNLNETEDAQLDGQVSVLLNAIGDMSLK